MTFFYDEKALKVVDDETGVEMYVRGRPEVDLQPFEFFDPKSSVTRFSQHGPGKFRFVVSPILRVEEKPRADGSVAATAAAVVEDRCSIHSSRGHQCAARR